MVALARTDLPCGPRLGCCLVPDKPREEKESISHKAIAVNNSSRLVLIVVVLIVIDKVANSLIS